jgi:hypothetical protein
MERSSDYGDMAAALAPLRPSPSPAFAAELDERMAAGFPARSPAGASPFAALAARLRGLSPQRLLFAAGGAALASIAIATVVVASLDPSQKGPVAIESHATRRHPPVQFSKEMHPLSSQPNASGAAAQESATTGIIPFSHATDRDIERSAEIGLLAEPADVADDSAQVFDAVHNANGIVLHSTTTRGRHAGADFDLLIPSAKLGDAMAAFSAIDEVRTRHEATDDITAPTVASTERLQSSQAKIDGLLAQLSSAETESEREAVEIELGRERRHAAGLRSHLDSLHQRSGFSRVSLRIETSAAGTPSSGGNWGAGDALGDASHILSIAAGVTLVGLAALAPLALIGLLAWLGHRAWLRARREQALSRRV